MQLVSWGSGPEPPRASPCCGRRGREMQAMAEVLSQGCRGSLGEEGASSSGRWQDPTGSSQAEQEPSASRRAEGRENTQ